MNWENTNRDRLAALYSQLNQQVPTILGATISDTPNGHHLVQVKKSVVCLKRFKTLIAQSSYLVTDNKTFALQKICGDENKDLLLESYSYDGRLKVIVRKEGEKDIWIEVWSADLNGGMLKSTKISGECARVYNDTIFGGVNWSRDNQKVTFIGESPPITSFKNPWDQTKKIDEKKDGDEHWQDEKFDY